jgi:hypothetical protein
MIGAEPPRWTHRAQAPGAVLHGQQPAPASAKTSLAWTWTAFACRCAPARWWALPGCRATARKSCCTRCRVKTAAPRAASHAHGFGRGKVDVSAHAPRRAAQAGAALCARRAAGPRCGAHAGPGAQPAAHAQRIHRLARVAGSGVKASCRRRRQAIMRAFNVKAGGPNAAAVAVGRQFAKVHCGPRDRRQPKLLIVSQPTWGVDVGAAAQIRGEILALRDAGCAVLVVSEELDELFEMSDRLHVMPGASCRPPSRQGRSHGQKIGEWMSGLWHEEGDAAVPPIWPTGSGGGGPCSSLKPAPSRRVLELWLALLALPSPSSLA